MSDTAILIHPDQQELLKFIASRLGKVQAEYLELQKVLVIAVNTIKQNLGVPLDQQWQFTPGGDAFVPVPPAASVKG